MHTQYLIFDNSRYGHTVETIDEGFPQFYVIPILAYVRWGVHS
jgi:hypothetical protein